MDKKLSEVTYLRVYAIMSLVAWHSYCSYTAWGIGNSPLDCTYSLMFMFFAPTANMPLFTFLSGYLFCFLFKEKGKYTVFNGFLKNKVNRLLIPYLILGFIINLTQIGRGKPLMPMFYGAPNHMWYCLMLFYCFVICWLVENKLGQKYNIFLALLSYIFVLFVGRRYLSVDSPLGWYMLAYFYSYFYMGFLTFQYADGIFPFLQKYFNFLCVAFVCSVIAAYYNYNSYGVSSILFVSLLITITRQIKMHSPLWIEVIAKYSFGIYVFHQWIIWNVTHYEPMRPIIHEHFILFPLILYVSVFSLSYLLTHISLKTRFGRYLLT